MNSLYNVSMALLAAGTAVGAVRSSKLRDMRHGHTHIFEDLRRGRAELAPEGYDVWFHAASLGEFEQARPVIERYLSMRPEASVLLSFFSPSGYNVRRNFHPRVTVVYLPFDRPALVKQFLDEAQPRMAIFVKYEFWGNFLSELKSRAIPTYIISAIFRPGQIFFKPWGGMFRRMLRCFDRLYVQDEASRLLLAGIGVDNVTVAGDTRLDRVAAIHAQARRHPQVDAFEALMPRASNPVMVAGSSWPADEDIYIPFLKSNPKVRAIIAPHEFDDQRVEAMRQRLGAEHTAVLSELEKGEPLPEGCRYLIVDCFGWLSSLYGYADFAYVGGGFGAGLHNINEAAAFGVPVIYGPNNRKFREAADLAACGGGFCVHNAAEFAKCASKFVADEDFRTAAGKKAGQYIAGNIGATDIIVADLFEQS